MAHYKVTNVNAIAERIGFSFSIEQTSKGTEHVGGGKDLTCLTAMRVPVSTSWAW